MHTNPSFESSGAHSCAPYTSMSRVVLVVALSVLMSGCGLKGNLYLPDKPSTPVVVTPASSSSSSSSAASQATP